MNPVPIKTVISDLWADLSASQKFLVFAFFGLIFFAVSASWWQTFRTWSEVRVHEQAAIKANQEKQEAMELAAKIANTIRIREEELTKVEVKRDEKRVESKRAGEDVNRDRTDYERAVRERRTDAPSTEQLCRELSALGYPCFPR